MKLFVDDIRNAPDDTWMVARTVTSAIAAIAQWGNEMTEISLDHDISHQVSISGGSPEGGRPFSCAETFQAVAWFIAYRFSPAHSPKITIHSANPIGADSMVAILGNRGWEEKDITIKRMGAANRLETEI